MSGRVGEPNAVEAAALLLLPDMARMSDAQVRGAACAWCAVILSPATAVDLGERRIRLLDRHVIVRPRGCRTCVAARVSAVLENHIGMCERCVDNVANCELGSGLRRLEMAVTR